jgi:hypothetical protein
MRTRNRISGVPIGFAAFILASVIGLSGVMTSVRAEDGDVRQVPNDAGVTNGGANVSYADKSFFMQLSDEADQAQSHQGVLVSNTPPGWQTTSTNATEARQPSGAEIYHAKLNPPAPTPALAAIAKPEGKTP